MQMNLTMKFICLVVDIDLGIDLEPDNYESQHASNEADLYLFFDSIHPRVTWL